MFWRPASTKDERSNSQSSDIVPQTPGYPRIPHCFSRSDSSLEITAAIGEWHRVGGSGVASTWTYVKRSPAVLCIFGVLAPQWGVWPDVGSHLPYSHIYVLLPRRLHTGIKGKNTSYTLLNSRGLQYHVKTLDTVLLILE